MLNNPCIMGLVC
ncbi:MAG TPA: hypothetical protein DHV28_17560 [Ignavibacteriales bacterium]|nr:hypothetical protein [Ignavibacteriales bacterium]